MHEARRNLLIGLFVLVGLSALGTLIVLFGVGPTRFLGGRGYPLYIQFDSVSGIRTGNQVTLGGLEIGRVQEVGFLDAGDLRAGVRVTVTIDQQYQIPNGSRAKTTEPAFGQGRPPIEIIPGPPELQSLAPGSVIPGEMQRAMDALVPENLRLMIDKTGAHVGEAAEALTPVLRDLHEILERRAPDEVDRVGGPQGNLSTAMARLDGSLKHFNDVLGDPAVKSQVREAVANFHQASEDGKALTASLRASSEEAREVVLDAKTMVSEIRETAQGLDGEITAVCRDARTSLEQGSRFLDTLNDLAGSLSRGEGTVGRLIYDAKLYEAMVLTAERLAETVEEFRLLVKDWQKGKVRVGF